MLSKEDLSRIVKDEIENKIREGKVSTDVYDYYYYILLNGKIYQTGDYDEEVAKGKRSANDIYAYVVEWYYSSFDTFLFHTNYLTTVSVVHIVYAYLRKTGFTIKHYVFLPPTPNLKYFIYTGVKFTDHAPEYLVVNIYDVDTLARIFHIPQIVQQRLGNKPREITILELFDIYDIVIYRQPLLAGYTYSDAWHILEAYYVRHKKKYKNKAHKIDLAYFQLFPEPYKVCYEWEARRFVETDCLKLILRSFSS